MGYINHSVNNSPTLHGVAGAGITSPAMLAVKFTNGKFTLPAAGDPAIGIVLADAETVALNDEMDVQIKDICYWIAGGLVHAGSELATDAAGKAVVATEGKFILAIALEAGDENKPIKVQVVKAGYKSGGVITPIKLADCADVNLDALADGQVLTYDAAKEKFVNEAIPAQTLAGLSDVDLDTGTLADGQVLTFDGTDKFVNEAIPAIGLNDLTDVTLTEPFSDNDVVAYDVTEEKFINQAQV